MKDVDKGHAWLCFIGAIGASFLNCAIGYSSGVIHVGLLDYYKESVAKTASIGSLFSNLLCLLGPFGSIAINLTSCRVTMIMGSLLITIGMGASFFAENQNVILVTYGILAGSGFGLTVTTSIVVLGYAFEKYRGMAVGITMAFGGAGMFACGPMIQYLIDTYTMRGAFLILGALSFNFTVFGALMKPSGLEKRHKQLMARNKDCENKTSIIHRFFHFQVFKNLSFCLILAGAIFAGLPYNLILLHLPNYSVTQGYTREQAAFLMAILGLGSTANRILVGLASGGGGIDVLMLYFGSFAILGVCTVTFPLFSAAYIGQCVYAVIFGLYTGAFCALCNPLCFEMVGVEYLSTGVGLYFFFLGVGGLIGPIVAGVIVDNGGSYEISFYISGISFIISALLTLVAAVNKPETPTNLLRNGDITYSIDSLKVTDALTISNGSGFLTGSGFFHGSGFLTPRDIITGSGSFRGSGFIAHRIAGNGSLRGSGHLTNSQKGSMNLLKTEKTIEMSPLTHEENNDVQ